MDGKRVTELYNILADVPKIDVHTHLTADRLMARGLDDILLYHMVNTELYSAGSPSGGRVPETRSDEQAERRLEEAIPYLPQIRNTSMYWLVRLILADLYDWQGEVTSDNWRELHGRIKSLNREDGKRAREIMKILHIEKIGTEIVRRCDGRSDDIFEYALEWAFFARTQWGQPDISLFELERAWNATGPEEPIPVTLQMEDRPKLSRVIETVEDIDAAVSHYCSLIPYGQIKATAQHISTDIDYGRYSNSEVQAALDRRREAGRQEQNVFSSRVLHTFLRELEKRGDSIVFQFSIGAEALPFESGMRLRQETIGQLAALVASYPGLRFMCFNAGRHTHQSLCTLVRELPNLSLGGFWWHGFFPGAVHAMAEERLDMVPINRQCDYMTDAYCMDWVYAKNRLILSQFARIFAEKLEMGQYGRQDIRAIAEGIFHDSAQELLGF
ncbi:MAG TPA: hypothetical protein VMX75_14400 [Spirochaetia bacterium]|nr:hypothetical protein [Spirochaetia bacterium]